MGIYSSDLESSGLLEDMKRQENPRLHNFCAINIEDENEIHLFHGRDRVELQEFLDQGHTLVIHYGKMFDYEALDFFGFDTSKSPLIDSLALSWYLEPERGKHGLEEYGMEFGIEKPKITSWEDLTQEDYDHRVVEDCKIQRRLWKRQVERLESIYGTQEGSYDKIIQFLMWKMDEQVIQQRKKWKLDVGAAEILRGELEEEIKVKVDQLRAAMPQVPIYQVHKPPAKPYKKDQTISSTGEKWLQITQVAKLPFNYEGEIKTVRGYDEPNPASHTQIKSWLDSLGWEPSTFKYVREDNGKMREIPQVNLQGGEVCASVKELFSKCDGVEHIAGLGILNHRFSVVKGFLRDQIDGELVASCGGFTNTLRINHREIVNLPSLRVAYGERLRGLLVAREGYALLGSDLSSLEDRVKQSFQWPLDPEYVKTQMDDDFDGHTQLAEIAGLMTTDEVKFFKWYKAKH